MIISLFSEKWSKTLFVVGLFQLMLAYLFIGWGLSIFWGWLFVKKAMEDQAELQNFLDRANAKSDSVAPGQPQARATGPQFGRV